MSIGQRISSELSLGLLVCAVDTEQLPARSLTGHAAPLNMQLQQSTIRTIRELQNRRFTSFTLRQ